MPYIPYRDCDTLPSDVAAVVNSRPRIALLRMLPHAETLAKSFIELGMSIRNATEISADLRQMIILRVGLLEQADYEIAQHRRISIDARVPQWKIDIALGDADDARLDDTERLCLRFCDQIARDGKADDALIAEVAGAVTHRAFCEIILITGFYIMACRFMRNTGLEPE